MRLRRLTAIIGGVAAAGCQTSRPPASEAKWDAECVAESACSTHLWLVEQAARILAAHPEEPGAAAAAELLAAGACRDAWRRGLFDADFKGIYNDGRAETMPVSGLYETWRSGSSWKSHFYDPDTGLNYRGEGEPTALSQTLKFAAPAVEGQCYELGLSLHYFTDLSQPMHAANFTVYNNPVSLHSNLERYAMGVQARYALPDWDAPPAAGELAGFIVATARAAKARWPAQLAAVGKAYTRTHATRPWRCGVVETDWAHAYKAQLVDHVDCWGGDAGVDASLGDALRASQAATAQYLTLLGRQILAKRGP